MDSTNAPLPDIATPEEVLATFTELMRSEKSSEKLKAAEQLAKYHSLFVQKDGDNDIDMTGAVSAVEEAVAAILAEREPDA